METQPGSWHKGFSFLLCVLVLYSSPWQVLYSRRQLPSPCSERRTFSNLLQGECVCVYAGVCGCDVNCDPLRMDKWQKMCFFPSHPLPCFQKTGRGGNDAESVCLFGSPDAPTDPPPRSLSAGPRGRVGFWRRLFLSHHWQAKGGQSPTAQRWQRCGEAPWPQRHSPCQRAVSLRDLTPRERDSH